MDAYVGGLAKVYIVLAGVYSDKHIEAVCRDKKLAERFKEEYNHRHRWDDAYIEEYDVMSSLELGIREYYDYRFSVTADEIFLEEKELETRFYDVDSVVCGNDIYVYLHEDNDDKAYKVAEDLWAEAKALKAGI